MSFLKGFFSIFNLFPQQKSYQELTNELNNKMQNLYDKMGWGEYKKQYRMNGWNNAIDINMQNDTLNQTYIYSGRRIVTLGEDMKNSLPNDTTIASAENLYVKDIGDITLTTSEQFLDEMIKLVPKDKFIPYSYYNKDRDAIQVYWSNDESYTVPIGNGSMNLKIAFGTNAIIGVDILNANQLILENRKPLTLDEQQRYAIYWLYDRYVGRSDKEPLIVNGINITEVIQGLTGRLF